jgi:hypothetical protein
MRNNTDRLGADVEEVEEVSPVAEDVPEFEHFTTFVDLPSKGLLYPKGSPISSGQVEIYLMTAKHEDILADKGLLKSGKMLDRLIQALLVDKRINVKHIFSGDKSAILIAARIDAYGEIYKVEMQCPVCSASTTEEFNLSEETKNHELEYNDEFLIENGLVVMTLPRTKMVCKARLMNGEIEQEIFGENKNRKRSNLKEIGIVDHMSIIIDSLGSVSGRSNLLPLISNLPAADSLYFREIYKKANPAPVMEKLFSCGTCGFETTKEVAFSAEFFWPK